MELNYGIVHSSYKHIKYTRCSKNLFNTKSFSKKVLKNETFAFQIILNSFDEFLCSIGENNHICWKGLINKIRVSIDSKTSNILDNISISLVDYIKDDAGTYTTDIISDKKSLIVESGNAQLLFIKGKLPKDFQDESLDFNINLYYSKEYDEENLLASIPCNINILNASLPDPVDSSFYLDLWQHPSSLARQYDVELWSEDHFYILENFIKELASAGQKTITLVVTDFPWGGQGCFDVYKNSSNLFEHNIVKVRKDSEGNLKLDFSALDKYINICFKHGINKEIDLFGLIGNWHGKKFKSPVYPEYKDPFRVNYLDEKDNKLKYLSTKGDIHNYIKQLLTYFIDSGYIEKTRIFCDEPNNLELFNASKEFINSTVDVDLQYKCAVHDPVFLQGSDTGITDSSVFLPIIGEKFEKFEEIRNDLLEKGHSVTWFVCCFPQIPNQFISSPLLESRIVGHLTYMLKLSGFLRWNYCLYTENVYNDASYKFPVWLAGDTFFVYPGKNMKPVSSLRWENMKLGIEEFVLMKELEKKGYTYEDICKEGLLNITGGVSDMKGDAFNFTMNHSLNENDYEIFHENLINLLLK